MFGKPACSARAEIRWNMGSPPKDGERILELRYLSTSLAVGPANSRDFVVSFYSDISGHGDYSPLLSPLLQSEGILSFSLLTGQEVGVSAACCVDIL